VVVVVAGTVSVVVASPLLTVVSGCAVGPSSAGHATANSSSTAAAVAGRREPAITARP
jgi:hypothetical protein